MAKQTPSQKIGTLGHSIVETQIKASEIWIARNLTEDYGIDIELEYAPEEVKGKFIKAQIKSHRIIETSGDFISEKLTKKFLRYAYECRIPVILVICSTSNSKTWFTWLQKWLYETNNILNIYDESIEDFLYVNIHVDQDFKSGLEKEIIHISTWENKTQLFIAVKDLANLSVRLYDDSLSELLFDYLGKFQNTFYSKPGYLDVLLEKAIELGLSIWGTHEGNKVSESLFKYAREHGEKFNADHIGKLVLRGNELSRTGINVLGILYDRFPNYVASLNLTKRFCKMEDRRLFYYCSMKERYLGIDSTAWLTSKDTDFVVDELRLDFGACKMDEGDIWNKWANRGDSMIFDYVFIEEKNK